MKNPSFHVLAAAGTAGLLIVLSIAVGAAVGNRAPASDEPEIETEAQSVTYEVDVDSAGQSDPEIQVVYVTNRDIFAPASDDEPAFPWSRTIPIPSPQEDGEMLMSVLVNMSDSNVFARCRIVVDGEVVVEKSGTVFGLNGLGCHAGAFRP